MLWQIIDWELNPDQHRLPIELQRFVGMALSDASRFSDFFYHGVHLIRPGAPMIQPIECDPRIFKQPWRPWPRNTRPY
ncbi:MAG: hypothetical protein ABL932_07555 [Terricaulis sp.]